MNKIYIASDHAGYALKEELKVFLSEQSYTVEDIGAPVFDPADDYPDFVIPCAQKVASDTTSFGIVIGASGQGEAMAAGKVAGARVAVYYGDTSSQQVDIKGNTLSMISSARTHNDANILSLGARFITFEQAKKAVMEFLTTAFSEEERHKRRISKIETL